MIAHPTIGDNVPLRVLYDRAYLTSRSTHVFLASKYPFSDNQNRTVHMLATTARILPTSSIRPPVRHLPPAVLRRIVLYNVEKEIAWRRTVYSVASVCKSWAHIADIFFEHLGTSISECDKPTAHTVARSLMIKPERGRLIKRFREADFLRVGDFQDDQGSVRLEYQQAIVTAVEKAPFIRDISIHTVHMIRHVENLYWHCLDYTTSRNAESMAARFTMGGVLLPLKKYTALLSVGKTLPILRCRVSR